MAPARRRLLLLLVALVVAVAVVVTVLVLTRSDDSAPVAEDRPGPVLLVPGYGGSTESLQNLAVKLRASGREAEVVALPGEGTGDLTEQARVLDAAARAALQRTGAESVDVVGYSAGGVVARVWLSDLGGADVTRRLVTLGSPHHGTNLAALAGGLLPSLCPTACQQLDPDSDLLRRLNASAPAGPSVVSVWTTADRVVTPPSSAELDGALNLTVQSVCSDSAVAHDALPTDPVSSGIVLLQLDPGPPRTLGATDCAALRG
ncbi:alpha/beta fold hydrolase [Rhodococcus sp. X156]|uniref:lipase family alpha/beta hydrolase n=1 Tax=Rhodococcus sp. X156 TaxID=2499145 RepID=UPI0013E32747|nr:alpha/beta fold hydrolase [Rhodococcus sp. X156]